ncbi:mitochondrial carrier domain-containing protein [Gymnopilus junonius]|uniref:Mitochondrial carrier domain-containing protein n=1 Tax=Gymnopilus junonius TaxID=109634 RepID=A0A9P5NY14_GYMJU|nr:mitochondrial carrier domain-containing protein [Gymnopilus junonius]
MDAFHAKLLAAATGSTLTALTMTPFDLVKTRLQTQPPQSRPLFPRPPNNTCCQPSNAASCVRNMSSLARTLPAEVVCVWEDGLFKAERVNGFFDAVKHVWRAEGVRGLWKGAGTTLVIGVPSSSAYILTYDHLVHVVLPPFIPSAAAAPLFAGVIARSAITTIASPLELLRTNLQSTPPSPNNPHTLRSVLGSFRTLVKQNGFTSLWRGLGPTLLRDVPFSGFYWASYETWKSKFAARGLEGTWVAFISGAVSGTSAALLTSPFDVVKTRRQALIMSSINHNVSRSLPLLMQIVRTEGASALFAGITPRIAKIAPACGIMISCFEGIGKFLTKRT